MSGELLTPTERQVLALASNGLTRKEIAVRQSVTDHTIQTQLASIREKLKARSTTHAVAIALRSGIL